MDYEIFINIMSETDKCPKNMCTQGTSCNSYHNLSNEYLCKVIYYDRYPKTCKGILAPLIISQMQGCEMDHGNYSELNDGESYRFYTTPNVIISKKKWLELTKKVREEYRYWCNMLNMPI